MTRKGWTDDEIEDEIDEKDMKEFEEFLDQSYAWDGVVSTRREAWLSGEKGKGRESWLASRRTLRRRGKMNEMIYKIYCNSTLIARFKYEQDRNRCLVALIEEHQDCNWTIEGEKQDGREDEGG